MPKLTDKQKRKKLTPQKERILKLELRVSILERQLCRAFNVLKIEEIPSGLTRVDEYKPNIIGFKGAR